MSKYDDLFADTHATESVFTHKGMLDPLQPAEPAYLVALDAPLGDFRSLVCNSPSEELDVTAIIPSESLNKGEKKIENS